MLQEITKTLTDTSLESLEILAQKAKATKEQYFGRTVSLYAPIYLSNYCSSECTYCGFKSKNRITRFKLTLEQMHQEMKFVADQKIENILLLTGESYKVTPVSYLKEAVSVAKKYFPSISLEVHPMQTDDYKSLFECGVDGITVYQETYDTERYKQVHLSGIKSDYDFRYDTPKRAAKGGIRSISMGILLGLSKDIVQDVAKLYTHLRFMEKEYPGVEYSLSFPRFQSIKGEVFPGSAGVDDITFTKILCMTRILFPRVGINLSTRESKSIRDNILELGITRMSAGSNTSVGGYTTVDKEIQDPQFDIEDTRSVSDIITLLKSRNFDPILTDWRAIQNEIL
ncbi:MAG: 2-iminoacetate synthase [Lysobacterales bacterium]|jgi:2-iminoacetate synthase